MDINNPVVLANGEINLWIEQDSSIHLKSVTDHGDPVELSKEEAEKLVEVLSKMVAALEC